MRVGRFLRRIGVAAIASALVFLAVVIALVVFSRPPVPHGDGTTLDFGILRTDAGELPALQFYEARDGQEMPYRHYPSPNAKNVLVLLHGSAYHSSYLQPLASHLARNDIAEVFTPDLRGHGPEAERRGDVAYIGQVEDDVSDLVRRLGQRDERPVVLGGHSSGGGTAIRYAGGQDNAAVDGYLLLSPYVHYSAPTMPDGGSEWTDVATPRIVGLSILNTLGITAFNDEYVISFNMPNAVRDGTETLRYSYDLQISMHPRDDYGSDIAGLDGPSLLVVGAQDETFEPEAFRPLFAQYSPDTEVRILDGLAHFGVVTEPAAHREIAEWLRSVG
ncbi:alpha/beta fold hydrolase [Pseudonocardia sp.]|uniref:alpha/beta hydrolase n=1 Tax=Pseudonocardia sp. TaxID=60912 RepID=UPI0026276F8D|nr:alpha/beta fold hydrolase [Pseudonocardia sp.]